MKEVDDNEFMKMVASGGNTSEKKENPPASNTPRRKKDAVPSEKLTSGYIATFIQRGSENEKSTVYLSKELIGQLKNILATIGEEKATLGGYVEAIIEAHFNAYKDEIIRLFNENIKQPFQ